MNQLEAFLHRVKNGEPVEFKETMDVIAAHYDYRPARFFNGVGEQRLANEAGTNEGSCRIFAFARLQGLSPPETLALFGAYYRDEVLGDPKGKGHQNIRTFMASGWQGIQFESEPLSPNAQASGND